MKTVELLAAVVAACFVAARIEIVEAVYGTNNYVEYKPGDPTSRLVITTSHGGFTKPGSIPNRQHGCYIGQQCVYDDPGCAPKDSSNCGVRTVSDAYTGNIAQMLTDEIESQSGVRPHLVINHLYRGKMDPNREVGEGAQGNPHAITAWTEYHDFINQAKDAIAANPGGYGLLLDIHGQTHSQQWVEVGYTISKSKLNSGNFDSSDSTVRALGDRSILAFDDIIRDADSLGARIQDSGYKAVPSTVHPSPGSGGYYSGGYTIKTHGSKYGGDMDAIQLEINKNLRNSGAAPAFCADVAADVIAFMQQFYA